MNIDIKKEDFYWVQESAVKEIIDMFFSSDFHESEESRNYEILLRELSYQHSCVVKNKLTADDYCNQLKAANQRISHLIIVATEKCVKP